MPQVTWMQGDATDRAFADAACKGATTVYNCANPSDYARWHGVLEPLYVGIREAAGRVGARLVQLDNLYMYGRPPAPFDETTPLEPCTDKGELRRELLDGAMAAHRRGDVEVAVGHASDFFGADAPRTAIFRPDLLRVVAAGGTAWVFGDPDQPHSYSYIPDVARGLAILGSHAAAPGRRWHLPVAAQSTTRSIIERMAAHTGKRVRIRSIPRTVLRVAGWASPLVKALHDMSYQWEVPYVMDDRAFCRTFGVDATPLDQAIEQTLRPLVSSSMAA